MHPEALKLAATAFQDALARDDRRGLMASSRRLIDLDAPLGTQWIGLARAVLARGEYALALQALDTWSAQGAPVPVVAYEKAAASGQVGRTIEAAEWLAQVPEEVPTPLANAFLRGTLAAELGKVEEARRQFRRALAAAPQSGMVWSWLARLGDVSPGEVRRISELVSAAQVPSLERAALANALGVLAHEQGEHARAFEHFAASARLQMPANAYRMADDERSAGIARRWTGEAIAARSGTPPVDARRPIFVTGLPRSGTTLVEQILTAHSGVDGGQELDLAVHLEHTLGGFAPEDYDSWLAAGHSLDELRDFYLRLVAERIPGESAFVDKSLEFSRACGPLSAMFPDAPVVWLRRDALDNAWANYRTLFTRPRPWAGSLQSLAQHMQVEDRLLDHWRGVLGGRVLVVNYADLVEDPDHWIERITLHCGLQPEAQQREFYNLERPVRTLSVLQVREPITLRGLGVSEPYRAQLQPFIDAYGYENS